MVELEQETHNPIKGRNLFQTYFKINSKFRIHVFGK